MANLAQTAYIGWMDLESLGLDDWFREKAQNVCLPEHHLARVTTVDRDRYHIVGEIDETVAELTGKYLYTANSNSDFPCVGDWVCVQYHDSGALIHERLPRKSSLRRKSAGKNVDFQMIATNIDLAFVVQSCHFDFNLRRLERYLVMANDGNIEPVVLLTKTDLISPDELENLLTQISTTGIMANILPLSNVTKEGIDQVQQLMAPGKTYCFIGSSGVGKTTLINHLLGTDVLETKTVSGTGEGRHTTVRRQLITLENGAMLIDTPGMRELGIISSDEGVESGFSEIQELITTCRFSDCTHSNEPGCAILAALESGQLDQGHYDSFLKLKKEASFHQMSYVEKKKKDKNFGKMVKSVMKHKKKSKNQN